MKTVVLTILALCSSAAASPGLGRWTSSDNVSKPGSKFFLDVVVSDGGAFRGSWEPYDCFNYPGPYGIPIVACQRSRRGAAAAGRLDVASGSGRIELEGLGETSFRWRVTSDANGKAKLEMELPRDWLKEGAPVLYETSLSRR